MAEGGVGALDKFFGRLSFWRDASGNLVSRPDGSFPTTLQCGPGLSIAYDSVLDRYILTAAGGAGEFVPVTRIVAAGQGLDGGGALNVDISLAVKVDGTSVVFNGPGQLSVGAISDAAHGDRGGGTLHPTATPGTAGFMAPIQHVRSERMVIFSDPPWTTSQTIPTGEYLTTLNPDAAAGNLIATLPDRGASVGLAHAVKCISTPQGGQTVSLVAGVGDTIDGVSNINFTANSQSVIVYADRDAWRVIASHGF